MIALQEIGKRWVDAFNKKDMNALMALYTEDCVNAQPHLMAPLKGKRAVQEDLENFLKAFPDGRMTATTMSAAGDTLAMEWTFTGTQTAPLVGGPTGPIPATNKPVTIKGAEFTRHNGQGLIVDERGYFDLMSFMMQLGLMPQPQA
jgi:steroid delta-isomerase-like uncharacterized protein